MNITRYRPILLAALVVAALAVSAGCYPQPPTISLWTPGPPQPGDQTVVLFGDSLAAMARTPAEEKIAATTGQAWSWNAMGATRIQHWLAPMQTVTADDVVVVELMTNNVSLEAINTGEIPANLHAGLDAVAHARCVVFVTLNETGGDLRGFPYNERTRWVNDEVDRLIAAGTYPNLTTIDWNAYSAGHVDWLVNPVPGGDYLHYNELGNEAYADFIVNHAMEACLP